MAFQRKGAKVAENSREIEDTELIKL
jgi:hypothetical protein